jgi:hypothetical protein
LRPIQVDGDGLASLATCLFELRAACETQLRALTSVQRHLERVRSQHTCIPEAELLLSEIARQLRELRDHGNDIANCRGVAERSFEALVGRTYRRTV